jgi:hypothetical protein
MSHYDDEAFESTPKRICEVINETSVPIWVRMEQYKAQETRSHPDGMIWGPVIKIGTMHSPDVPMFGYHHACGLFRDGTLDGHSSDERPDGGWIYYPYEEQCVPNVDVSVYACDICHERCYRDDFGVRWNKSATIFDGGLVCRDCEVHGLIAPSEAREQMDRASKLARFIGGDTLHSYERGMEMFGRKTTGGGRACQTRLYKEDMYSFGWSTLVLGDDGKWKPWIHGGFIKHGPDAKPADGGGYDFTTWDYGKKCVRPATPEEINHICWSTHT